MIATCMRSPARAAVWRRDLRGADTLHPQYQQGIQNHAAPSPSPTTHTFCPELSVDISHGCPRDAPCRLRACTEHRKQRRPSLVRSATCVRAHAREYWVHTGRVGRGGRVAFTGPASFAPPAPCTRAPRRAVRIGPLPPRSPAQGQCVRGSRVTPRDSVFPPRVLPAPPLFRGEGGCSSAAFLSARRTRAPTRVRAVCRPGCGRAQLQHAVLMTCPGHGGRAASFTLHI